MSNIPNQNHVIVYDHKSQERKVIDITLLPEPILKQFEKNREEVVFYNLDIAQHPEAQVDYLQRIITVQDNHGELFFSWDHAGDHKRLYKDAPSHIPAAINKYIVE